MSANSLRLDCRYLLDCLNMIAPISEVSNSDYSNQLDINSAWKSLVASCVLVWLKLKHVFNTFISSAEVFISSVKHVRLQYQKCSTPAKNAFVAIVINLFVCSVICIWRWVAGTILSLAMNAFVCSVNSYLEVGTCSGDYLAANDKHIHLLFGSRFRNPPKGIKTMVRTFLGKNFISSLGWTCRTTETR